jgi:hypothetical protein
MDDAAIRDEEGGEEINEEIIIGDERIDDGDDEEDENEIREREDREQREKVIRLVANNDPSLSNIWIGHDDDEIFPNDGDWKGFGESMGRNTHINELTLGLDTSQMGAQLVHFFRGLAMNRCIQYLIIFTGIVSQSDELFLLLVPFFRDNDVFHELEIEYSGHRDGCFSRIAFALGQFNSLSQFSISGNLPSISEGLDASCELIEALAGHVGLWSLGFSCVPIGRNACSALANLLRIRGSVLTSLTLIDTQIDDEGADILSSGLVGNYSLANLHIGGNYFTEIGWQSIFAMLKSPQCKLKSLDLGSTDINDAVARSLTNALSCNSTLKILILKQIHSISDLGWRNLFVGLLQGPHCKLETLDLSHSWGASIESMIESLASALATNDNLKELYLNNIAPITSVGWQNFASVLRNPSSGLEQLDLTGNAINDDIISAFASVLTNNNQLRKFLTGHYSRNLGQITSVSHAAFSRMLCDTSTILNTYNSNHTLTDADLWSLMDRVWYEDIYPLLMINQDNSVQEAARIKIIGSHFSRSDINTQVFTEMKLSILPTAIAWMGHNNGSHGGRNLMFEFLRREPLVCDMKHMSKKRKAVD